MQSNAKHMLDKYQKHIDHNLGIHLQYADHSQWMYRAKLLMGVNDGGKRAMENGNRQKPVPRAAAAYGQQLKM